MQTFWNLFYLFAALLLWPRWAWAALRRGDYIEGITQKLTGRIPALADRRPVVWMHAYCVGEVLALRTLIERMRDQIPECQIVVSVFTGNGFDAAKTALPPVTVFFRPLDLSWTVRRVYAHLQPSVVVLSELELWPNLLLEAGRRNVPIMVVSTQINDEDLRFYRQINRWHRPALRRVAWWGAQSARDVDRIAELLGPAHSTRIVNTGSLKYDAGEEDALIPSDQVRRLSDLLGPGRVLVAGSTHEPEESMLLDVVQCVRQRHPDLRLLIAPRHRHRFEAIAHMLRRRGVCFVRRSDPMTPLVSSPTVILIDTIGELSEFWQLADFAFIGGTWAPGIGGHNPIEPARLAKPVCVGPYVWNIDGIVQPLLEAGGAERFTSAAELENVLTRWLDQPAVAQKVGRVAQWTVNSHRGAGAVTMHALRELLRETEEVGTS